MEEAEEAEEEEEEEEEEKRSDSPAEGGRYAENLSLGTSGGVELRWWLACVSPSPSMRAR